MKSKQYRRIEDYNIPVLKKRFNKMYQSYFDKDYGEAINYARSLIETTCKLCYNEIKGEEIEGDREFLNLNQMLNKTIELLKKEITSEEVTKILEYQLDMIVKSCNQVGKIRNRTSVSHGSIHESEDIQADETKFIMLISENMCTFLVDLLHTKTHSQKKGAIGSILDTEDLTEYGNEYVDEEKKVRYTTIGEIINSITLTFDNIDIDVDQEFISDHVRDYVEDDAEIVGIKDISNYKMRSDKKDINYSVRYTDFTEYVHVYINKEIKPIQ
ncbi:hypothetical protein CKN82_11225 [Carnobacterium divergens]|uniref:abortive infection family protein n=1 Tax=Carnobacterium divergens TaxID=2748 RepID=UPI0010716893|nr:abortive infection family protein [Carnobacterium divergens]TFI66657.1 hypothetical protein CKN70_11380 [Carnobacterium divergens]TFI78951.1 hypothetical protein CKN68_11340 [Carnobacterium divergens]TFI86091.1 hypothetical protein CKN72_11105 [Carnobacterium divergens]TFI95310.1 hypothetical protein CKN67_11345 [Carnobacterium divergens]TFI96372.1 hypothetical protein CKN82_11225 [Carnobacterium divergens]